jgi:two-component system NarL family sensor kinase
MQEKYPEVLTQFIATITIALLLVGFIVIIFQLYQKRKLIQEKEKQQMKTAFEKELLQTQLEIQEEVLKNVSMEIHDNIGQIMLLANVNLSIIQRKDPNSETSELILDTKKMLIKAGEDISQLSRTLNSDRITELGVFDCILIELDLLHQKGLFTVIVYDSYEDTGKGLPKETQLLIFRMYQEICNNIIKHAKATTITVGIERKLDLIELKITDNGIGFEFLPSKENASKYNGVGLRSLLARTKLFGGELRIDSILEQGTSISIFIPD